MNRLLNWIATITCDHDWELQSFYFNENYSGVYHCTCKKCDKETTSVGQHPNVR